MVRVKRLMKGGSDTDVMNALGQNEPLLTEISNPPS